MSNKELHDAFAEGWEIEALQAAQCEVRPDFTEMKFSEGGPKVWFAIIKRQG